MNEIDIISERIKLSKFLSEYDLEFLPEDLKGRPYLTLMEFAKHSGRPEGIPHSILEDDLPKIKPRYYSMVNDPFFDENTKTLKDSAQSLKICFTVHRFPYVMD